MLQMLEILECYYAGQLSLLLTSIKLTVLSLYRDFKPYPMTLDHKPSREDEHKRIRDAGGFVINNRVMGELAVSRAFGDSEFKRGSVYLENCLLI